MTIKERFTDFVIDDNFDSFDIEAWDEIEEIPIKMTVSFWEIIYFLVESRGWHKLCALDRFPAEFGPAEERELLEEMFIHKMTK